MQRNDKWPEEYEPEDAKSRPSSRRNSASSSRRNSTTKKEKDLKKKSPLNSTVNSSNSTPKRVGKPQNYDLVVTGKQCLKKSDRANSLPGYQKKSAEVMKTRKLYESPKRNVTTSQSSKSRETSLEDDMSLDLSQVSDFEDTTSKYGKKKFEALATSTPKSGKTKPRSCSLQSQMLSQKLEESRRSESRMGTGVSSESWYKASPTISNYSRPAQSSELDYSSVSPEYSGQSSADLSPRPGQQELTSPRTQEMNLSSGCASTWQDCSEMERTTMADRGGEWASFWANYNNSVSKVPVQRYYDQCPTPYRTENIDLADLEFSTDGSKIRSPDNVEDINYIIRNEGLHLTPRETQNIIKCAHILGNLLSKAIDRQTKTKHERVETQTDNNDPELEIKKKTLTLELKETNTPADAQEEKRCETVTTQTDISLPNTKSAPKIFEKILRQLSKTSLDDNIGKMLEKNVLEEKIPVKEEEINIKKE